MTANERKQHQKQQRLSDRRDYRQSLINRQEETDRKIKRVELEIRNLQEGR